MSKKNKVIGLIVALLSLLTLMHYLAPANTLDARLSYSYSEALEYFWQLTPVEQKAYAMTEVLDFLLIGVYTTLLLYFVRWVLPAIGIFTFVAFIPGFFDLIETTTIFLALVTNSSDYLFAELGSITTAKWLSGFGVVVLTLATLSRRGSRDLSRVD